MIQDAVGYILIFGSAVLLSVLMNYKRSARHWFVLVLFLVIGFLDNFCYSITNAFPGIQVIETNIWNNYLECNWSAKIYSIVLALIIFFLSRGISRNDIGLRLKQNSNSVQFSLLFVLFFVAAGISVGMLGGKGEFDAGILLYLAVMPGLNEELIYRGFLLGLLNRIFDRRFRFLNTSFGWGAIIVSIVFGLLHGLHITDGFQVQIENLFNVILTGIFGFIFTLMKERSGSLVFPIIGHGCIDFFHFLIRML